MEDKLVCDQRSHDPVQSGMLSVASPVQRQRWPIWWVRDGWEGVSGLHHKADQWIMCLLAVHTSSPVVHICLADVLFEQTPAVHGFPPD